MDFKPMIVVFLVLSVCQVNGWFGQEEDNVKSMATLMRKMDSIQLEIDSIKRSMEIQEKKKNHASHGSGKQNQVSCDQVKICMSGTAKQGDEEQPDQQDAEQPDEQVLL